MKPVLETTAGQEVLETWRSMLELAAREVFDIMLQTRLERSAEPEGTSSPEYTAMVGLAGSLCGVISLRCTAQSASLIASKMLGVPIEEARYQSRDAIGEISNMIAGDFKTKLSNQGSSCMLSVPTVISGADYQMHSLAEGGAVEVRLQFEGAPLSILLEVTATS